MSNSPGCLIVFEGVEGAGKSTQLVAIHSWLRALLPLRQIVKTKQPGDTQVGRSIRQLLLNPDTSICPGAELLLFAADRAQHVKTILKPFLAQGSIVLCDRYTASAIAYQGYGRGLDLDQIETIDNIATAGVVPDLTILLDLDTQIGLDRAKSRAKLDRIEFADAEFHDRVRQGYRSWSRQQPSVVTIAADRPASLITIEIQTAILAAELWNG